MDSCVIPIRNRNLFMVQTTDYFYPIVDDPYMMGKIACANVVSDLYAMGVTDIDNMLMLLSLSNQMSERENEVVAQLAIQGFKDAASKADVNVTGGDTNVNAWFTIGGVATSICTSKEFILPENAVVGDVLIVTKPLGTQMAVSAHSWLTDPEHWLRISKVITEDEVKKAYLLAMKSMARLNRMGAHLMQAFDAHGATDITGYGILGHAQNLAMNQKAEVSFVIQQLPVIAKIADVARATGYNKLFEGTAPETSGGLLICLSKNVAVSFCSEMEKIEGLRPWIVGYVVAGDRSARLSEKPRIIEVPYEEKSVEMW